MSAIVHSNFSLLEGASSIPALLDRAAELGHRTVALADTNGMYGAITFHQAARARGLRPVLGADLRDDTDRAIVLARDMAGYSALCRLVTRRHLEPRVGVAQTLADEHAEQQGHLAILTASTPVLEALAPFGTRADVSVLLERARPTTRCPQQDLATRFGRPLAAVPAVYFATPEGYPIHRVLTAIRRQTSVAALTQDELADAQGRLRAPREIAALFDDHPRALAQTQAVLERCRLDLDLGRLRFPSLRPHEEEPSELRLRRLAYDGAQARHGVLRPDAMQRLEHELAVIEQLGYVTYFLIVHDIVSWAQARGIPCMGRGSAAGSLVAYTLGLTNVDPIHHNLYFERFLNPQRSDPPDIDIDLCWRRRQEVLEYVYERHGHDRVAMICTYSTLGARAGLREVAKALGVDEAEIDRVVKRLPHGSLEHALARTESANLPLDQEPWRSVLTLAQAIDGFPRHLSTHAGGLVIAPDRLTDLTPVQRSANGLRISQYDMHGIQALGLIKIDLLGQRSLSVVADTVQVLNGGDEAFEVDGWTFRSPISDLKSQTSNLKSEISDLKSQISDLKFDIANLPYNDPKTLALINRGKTIGCFQLESPGMRSLLQKMDVREQETLIAAISVIRPGPADAGMMARYVARHNGEEPVHHLHPRLAEVLRETYGILLYQEDTLRVAQTIAGMDLGQADLLRRAMTKDRGPETMARFQQQFLDGAAREGIDPEIAREVWRRISHFAGYAFCKAHSAAYARLAYEAAYLKAHHPAVFMAKVLANGGGFYSTPAYIEECRRMGLRLLPPDINKSQATFTAQGPDIRVGLGQIKNLSAATIAHILQERRRGPFLSFGDVRRRLSIGPAELRDLIRVGVFDGFELSRPELLWRLETQAPPARQRPAAKAQLDLFDLDEAPSAWSRVIPRVAEYTRREKLLIELELLGFGIEAHPLVLFAEPIRRFRCMAANALPTRVGSTVHLAGRPVAGKSTRTGKGESMRFLTLDDPTDIFEVTLFPRVLRQYGWVLSHGGPYLIEGKVESDRGSISVTAQRLAPIRLDDERVTQLAS